MNPSTPSLKGRALRLLAAREHSRTELERKLRAFEETPGELVRVLDELQAKGFVDEQRVIESVVHRRAGRLGASRIRHELQAKGLDAQSVQEAVALLQGTELERARAVWRKQFPNRCVSWRPGALAPRRSAGSSLELMTTRAEQPKEHKASPERESHSFWAIPSAGWL